MSDDLNELRKIAEAATPGPWTAETHCAYTDDNYHAVYCVESGDSAVLSQLGCGCCDVGLEVSKPDTAFITTFNPETTLALITRLEQAEQAVARVREALSGHPRTCDQHTEADPVKCGWKRAVIDVQDALDGDGRG